MLVTFSHEPLKMLANATGETAHVAVREGRQAFFIDHCTSPTQIILVSGQAGEFVPLYCTAHGKALLADCGLAELKTIFGTAHCRRTQSAL
jgi:DNA-binding IclR family transcriptional regulator